MYVFRSSQVLDVRPPLRPGHETQNHEVLDLRPALRALLRLPERCHQGDPKEAQKIFVFEETSLVGRRTCPEGPVVLAGDPAPRPR